MSSERTEIKIRRLSIMQDWREGLILNYRLGRKTQYPTQCLIKVLGVEPSDAKRMIGSKVGWPVDDPKIFGKIIGVHSHKPAGSRLPKTEPHAGSEGIGLHSQEVG
jgi:large subunit ribosomal protein L35Ae